MRINAIRVLIFLALLPWAICVSLVPICELGMDYVGFLQSNSLHNWIIPHIVNYLCVRFLPITHGTQVINDILIKMVTGVLCHTAVLMSFHLLQYTCKRQKGIHKRQNQLNNFAFISVRGGGYKPSEMPQGTFQISWTYKTISNYAKKCLSKLNLSWTKIHKHSKLNTYKWN